MPERLADLPPRRSIRRAEVGLLVATITWGLSFTWAKHGGEMINRLSGAGERSIFGPTLLMGVRFVAAGVAFLVIFPAARRGWSRASIVRSIVIGGFMGVGTIAQVVGLDRTSEAVSAFLTSLTILFVPLLLTLGLGKPPAGIFWLGVGLASGGIWLMTGAMPSGFGVGETLGLLTALSFSFQIITTNVLIPKDDPFRITAGELIVSGAMGLIVCVIMLAFAKPISWSSTTQALLDRGVQFDLLRLILGPTVVSYACMSLFQPKVDATRATLIYLLEPVAAATFARLTLGRRLGVVELCGALLILSANLVVEMVMSRRRPTHST